MPLTLPAVQSAATLLVNSTVWIFGGLSTQPTNGLYTLDLSVAWPTSSPSIRDFSNYGANSTFLFPRSASAISLGADGSSLWVYGGNSDDNDLITFDQFAVFDTQAKTWWDPQQGTSSFNGGTPVSIYAQSAVSNSKGVAYYYGGLSKDPSLTQDTPTLTTLDTRKSNLTLTVRNSGTPGNLAWHTATLVNDTLMYVIGGQKQDSNGNPTTNFYSAVYNVATNKWISSPVNSTKYPQGRSAHSAVLSADSSQIIIFGGLSSSNVYLNDVWTLNLATNQWTQRNTSGTAPSGRAYHSSVLANNQMIVLFGNANSSSQVYVLDTTKWAWVTSFTPVQSQTGPIPSGKPDSTPDMSNSTSNSTTSDDVPVPVTPTPISKAGVAGIIVIGIIIISVATASVSKPKNRIKPQM